MSKYIRVTMIYESEYIANDPQGFKRAINDDLEVALNTGQFVEPNAMTIEVLDTEDADATV